MAGVGRNGAGKMEITVLEQQLNTKKRETFQARGDWQEIFNVRKIDFSFQRLVHGVLS